MKTLTYIKSILFISLLVSACTSESSHNHADVRDNDSLIEGEHGNHLIGVSPQQFESSGFQLGKISRQPFKSFLTVSGSTHLPEKNKAVVSSYVGGTISDMEFIHGQWVKKGQRVFSISNPDLITWQQDYLVLQSEIDFQKSEYARQKALSEEKIAPKKNLKQTESILNVSKAKLAGTRKKLSLIGIDPSSITADNLLSSLNIYAPSSGYISDIHVKRGMYLEPFVTAMEISNTNHIHMELKVMEKDLPSVSVGQKVSYTLQNNQDVKYEASIYLIEKMVDENRMVNVHCHLSEEEEKSLIPGMYVTAEIELENRERLAMPEDGVVAFDGEFFVLKQEAGSKYDFEQVEVEVGSSQNGFYELLNKEGLDTTINYLTKGAYYLVKGEDIAIDE